MSVIADLGPGMSNLPDILHRYETTLAEYEQHLTLTGKTLEVALKEQPAWSAFYSERMVELSTASDYIEAQIRKVRGKLTAQYNENYNPKLTERQTEKYIDKEPEYLQMYELLLEVNELLEKYKSVVEAFNRRGFALRDITTARVNSIQEGIL